jgi:predicted aspartyl protease
VTPGAWSLSLLAATLAVMPARSVAGGPVEATPPDAVAESAPLYAQPSTLDRIGRILVPIEINGTGPFRFILDTGANRSAVSARTVALLGLAPDPARPIGVHGVTGSAVLPAVDVASMSFGEVTLVNRRLPVLADDVFADADGILGIDSLQQARVEVNFGRDRVTIHRSTGRRAPRDYLVVPAKLREGGLLQVEGRVGSVKVQVILDTGAERSLGNHALHLALVGSEQLAGAGVPTIVFGATPTVAEGAAFETPVIMIGEAHLRNLTVAFGDFHVFRVWGLEEQPALLIGMDLLGFLKTFVIDYRRMEFQLLPVEAVKPVTRSCGAADCRILLPRR